MKYLIIAFVFCGNLAAQTTVIDCNTDLNLLNSLVLKGKNSEALLLSADMLQSAKCKPFNDSIYFLRGLSFYQQQKFDSAILNLLKVKQPDTLTVHAQFLASLNMVYNSKLQSSISILNKIQTNDILLKELLALQKSGNCLLLRDFSGFTENSNKFSYSYYTIQGEEKKLLEARDLLTSNHFKSPAKAAWLSVIIPGAGKWYSKSRGKAVAAFLTVAVLSSITAEQAIKRGWKHYGTWTMASATGVFYMGNIYGSYYQAKQYNKKLEQEIDEKIRYNMHVSLRNVYY